MATKTSLQRDDNGRSLIRLELENNTQLRWNDDEEEEEGIWHKL